MTHIHSNISILVIPCQFKCTSLFNLQSPKRLDHDYRGDDKILQLTEVHRQQLAELKLRNEKLRKEKASKEVARVWGAGMAQW